MVCVVGKPGAAGSCPRFYSAKLCKHSTFKCGCCHHKIWRFLRNIKLLLACCYLSNKGCNEDLFQLSGFAARGPSCLGCSAGSGSRPCHCKAPPSPLKSPKNFARFSWLPPRFHAAALRHATLLVIVHSAAASSSSGSCAGACGFSGRGTMVTGRWRRPAQRHMYRSFQEPYVNVSVGMHGT